MLNRNIVEKVLTSLKDTPVIFIEGGRQTGKTTLTELIRSKGHVAKYYTLDDPLVFSTIERDPYGFITGTAGNVIIDEVQKVPELFTAIKRSVDQDRTPGRFLLTGSADALIVPKAAEALVGRMEVYTLYPLSQGELQGKKDCFIESLFKEEIPQINVINSEKREDLVKRILKGGYPEAVQRLNTDRRQAWFSSYLSMILQRDIRDLSHIEKLGEVPRLLSLLAARTGTLLNFSEIARSIGYPQTTLKRYFGLLKATFLVDIIPAWSTNMGKRLVKTPKLIFNDTGLLGHLLHSSEERFTQDNTELGSLIETFVGSEIKKQLSWSDSSFQLYHYRSHTKHEVDFVIESNEGKILGIEVKSKMSISKKDIQGLLDFKEATSTKFHRGILIYTGSTQIALAKDLHAFPINALWEINK